MESNETKRNPTGSNVTVFTNGIEGNWVESNGIDCRQVMSWLKSVGDWVEMGEAVIVVESDKAMDVDSYDEGYLAAIITGKML